MLAAGLDFRGLGPVGHPAPRLPEAGGARSRFVPAPLPVSPGHLENEGLSPVFVSYMRNWKGFVGDAV